ncbi:hypothetical protein MBLNU457_5787t1 [Dothideomycetes sp. NU457]
MFSILLYQTFWLVVLLLVAVYNGVQVVQKALFSPLASIPGPWYARFTRLRLKGALFGGQRTQYVHRLHQKYGSIARIAPNEVSICDVASFKEIHRGTDTNLGVFSLQDPKLHAQRRRLLSRGFSQNYLRSQWEHVIRDKVNLTIAQIKSESARNGSADVLKWFMFMASDVIANLSFGESFHAIESGVKPDYIKAIEDTGIMMAMITEMNLLYQIGRQIPIPLLKRVLHADDRVLEQGKLAVINSKSFSQSTNIFASIVAEAEKGETTLIDADIQSEAGNFMIAGSDTTSNTLTYLIWAVVSRPDVRQVLEQEAATVEEPLTDAKLEHLPILNAVIDETLRLYGAAPATLPRVVPKGGATLAGYFMPEGTVVGTQAYTYHRDSALFPDPEKFDYTRWLSSNNQISDAAKAAYNPFGAGSRICIGIHLAKMELRLAATTFFRECRGARLAPATTDESMEIENYFLISPKGHACEIVV